MSLEYQQLACLCCTVTWPIPAADKDSGVHQVVGSATDSLCRTHQRSQLSYVGQPFVNRRPVILSKLHVSHGTSDVTGQQNTPVVGGANKLLLHSVAAADSASHVHRHSKVSQTKAAATDNNVIL